MSDTNILVLAKGSERYVFFYDDASRAELLRTLGRFASNPELSFDWFDAATLSKKIRAAREESDETGIMDRGLRKSGIRD
jgi:hypothetical protein